MNKHIGLLIAALLTLGITFLQYSKRISKVALKESKRVAEIAIRNSDNLYKLPKQSGHRLASAEEKFIIRDGDQYWDVSNPNEVASYQYYYNNFGPKRNLLSKIAAKQKLIDMSIEEARISKKGYAIFNERSNDKLSNAALIKYIDNDIHFISSTYNFNRTKRVKKYRIVVIGSEDIEKMNSLYSTSARQSKFILKRIKELEDYDLIENTTELAALIKKYREDGINPIVVYNNNPNISKCLIENEVADIITCRSKQLSKSENHEIRYQSLTNIGIEDVLKGLKNVNQNESLFEFYQSFANNYSLKLRTRRKINAAFLITSSGIGIGGVTFIIKTSKK